MLKALHLLAVTIGRVKRRRAGEDRSQDEPTPVRRKVCSDTALKKDVSSSQVLEGLHDDETIGGKTRIAQALIGAKVAAADANFDLSQGKELSESLEDAVRPSRRQDEPKLSRKRRLSTEEDPAAPAVRRKVINTSD